MAAKYIFLAHTDGDGKPLDAGHRQKQDELAKQISKRLGAGDGAAVFDELMREYSQDTSLAVYPHGRLFATGTRDPAFEKTYRALQVGQYSDWFTTAGGAYLLLRMPIFPEMIADPAGHKLRYWVANQRLFKKQVDGWCAEL